MTNRIIARQIISRSMGVLLHYTIRRHSRPRGGGWEVNPYILSKEPCALAVSSVRRRRSRRRRSRRPPERASEREITMNPNSFGLLVTCLPKRVPSERAREREGTRAISCIKGQAEPWTTTSSSGGGSAAEDDEPARAL